MQNTEREQAFRLLIKDNELLIFKVCAMYAHTSADRKDLFQDIVLQLWVSFPRFRGDSKISTWIYRVGINTAITCKRKTRTVDQLHDFHASSIPAESNADKELIEDQTKELHAAISKLNEIEKAIVMLYLEDKSYEEMSDILGINEGTLRVKMTRIKDRLRLLTKTK